MRLETDLDVGVGVGEEDWVPRAGARHLLPHHRARPPPAALLAQLVPDLRRRHAVNRASNKG